MPLRDHETGRIRADELVLGGSQDDSLRTLRIGALAQEVVGRILLTKAVGNLTDALVHIPEERLVQRQTLFLLFLHREILAGGPDVKFGRAGWRSRRRPNFTPAL